MKNIVTVVFLVVLVVVGIGYAVFSDPDFASKQIFDKVMTEFAKNAKPLESQYRKNSSLLVFSKVFDLSDMFDKDKGEQSDYTVNMQVLAQQVILTFSDGDWAFANQAVILEPFIKDEQVRWKCIAGSLLVRLRSKDCRLGKGVIISEL